MRAAWWDCLWTHQASWCWRWRGGRSEAMRAARWDCLVRLFGEFAWWLAARVRFALRLPIYWASVKKLRVCCLLYVFNYPRHCLSCCLLQTLPSVGSCWAEIVRLQCVILLVDDEYGIMDVMWGCAKLTQVICVVPAITAPCHHTCSWRTSDLIDNC